MTKEALEMRQTGITKLYSEDAGSMKQPIGVKVFNLFLQ
jgi:hypothetical protein